FYNLNFFHDWYYDSGFDELAGNAQESNYGRGGLEGDSIKAEAQDFSGRNNANMTTPADGARPRMQMFLFDGFRPSSTPAPKINIATAAAATGGLTPGDITLVGTAAFGATFFNPSGEIVRASPDVSGCNVPNNAVGKIVFIDRGVCAGGFAEKAQNAQLGG